MCVKVTHKFKHYTFFGLMYFRDLLGVNLYLKSRTFSSERHFILIFIMAKKTFQFLQSHLTFHNVNARPDTTQKMKFCIKDFVSKCAQIRKKLRIWSHLLKKSLMEEANVCAVWTLEDWLFHHLQTIWISI